MAQRKSDRFATCASSHQPLSRMFANDDDLPNADRAFNDVLSLIVMPSERWSSAIIILNTPRGFDETL